MSAWRIVVQRLHEIGGRGHRTKFDDPSMPIETFRDGLRRAKKLGLVSNTGLRRKNEWFLTEKGRFFCEGKMVVREQPRAKTGGRAPMIVSANWMMGLGVE